MLVSLPDLYSKGQSNTGGKLSKIGRFLVETKRNKHILAGYNVAYRLHLNFTDTTIIQTRGSFDDRLRHVAISY